MAKSKGRQNVDKDAQPELPIVSASTTGDTSANESPRPSPAPAPTPSPAKPRRKGLMFITDTDVFFNEFRDL